MGDEHDDAARERWPDPPPDPSEDGDEEEDAQVVQVATKLEPEPGLEPEETTIFVDTSAMVALVDQDDASHASMVEAYRQLVDEGYRMFTTNYVMAETFDLLMSGVGPAVARQWLRYARIAVYHADEQDVRKARQETLRATSGRGLSLTDAVSLMAMKRLNVSDALAADPDFLADAS